MGYTTYFSGSFEFDKPVTDELRNYINKFSDTRRMMRDNDMIKALYPNWKELCFNGELGRNGEYFVGGTGFAGQDEDLSIINYNMSDPQPGLWCQWVIEGDMLVWDEDEKFYDYVKWLEYLIKHFFAPSGYVLNGAVFYDGEDPDDFGKIIVTNNIVRVVYGKRVYDEVI
jgi:hypothetical protein